MKKQLFIVIVYLTLTGQLRAQKQEYHTSIYSSPTQLRITNKGDEINEDWFIEKELAGVVFSLKNSFFSANQYLQFLSEQDITSHYPIISVAEHKEYEYIFCQLIRARTNNLVKDFYYLALIRREDQSIIVLPDFNLNYSFKDDSVIKYNNSSRFQIDFENSNLTINNPFLDSSKDSLSIPEILVKPSKKILDFRNDFEDWNYMNSSKLKLNLSLDFGLGGGGFHSYRYRSKNSSTPNSRITYQYGFRTSHLSIEPNIDWKKYVLFLGIKFERRQPKEGEYIYQQGDESFVDNGIAKIFPTGQRYSYAGLGYKIHCGESSLLIPYLKIGKTRYTGFQASRFNDIHQGGRTYIGGISLNFFTQNRGLFNLNFSYSHNKYKIPERTFSNTLQADSPELKSDVHINDLYVNDLNKYYQLNISFGYTFTLIKSSR